MTFTELRVGVVGAGAMGRDHLRRLHRVVAGARVTAVIEPDTARRAAALDSTPGAAGYPDLAAALAAGGLDAVLLASPGPRHEDDLLRCLAARLPVLCEKPLCPDAAAARRVVDAELAGGRRLIQVGFMRRFDPEYAALRELIARGGAGELLMLHAVHRNPSVPAGYRQSMLITDSVVHEFDVLPWLAGAPVTSIEVRYGRRNPHAPEHLREPILVLIELAGGVLADVEMSVSAGFGYQVTTEAVLSRGVARIGAPAGLRVWAEGASSIAEHRDYTTRFAAAYDREVQDWITAVRAGGATGPSAWDGYRAALCCEAGVSALESPGPVPVDIPPTPDLYR
ncbi:Gfo/Idh/MocA family oxidoreductase [Gordonia sp. (in: high G+C Gram-positive bacteria)]|uniref:Gfo/Idh/MocA family protein n=1 Tax=Gordonia sp. (in: high G+C Gram-positive bacteria) TaxID=84139 RepID=UPI0026147B3B|nr:Gfo/Idh/MocA family oxidoreductase [Gordonia sp. (in: high G+C Gram-positive bacteria)]